MAMHCEESTNNSQYKTMFQEKAKSAKILALQRRFSSCSNLGKQSDVHESTSARHESHLNGYSQDRKHVVNEKFLSSSMSSSSMKAPHFVSQLYHPVEKNAQNNFESKLIHSSSVETPPPTTKFQTTRLRSGSCPQVWQPLKLSFPINIQTSMNNSNSSLHNACNEHNNVGMNKNVKHDHNKYNHYIQQSNNPINSFGVNAQRFKNNIDNNVNNIKFNKSFNNNNFSDNKGFPNNSNISYDNSNNFRINSTNNSPLLKKNEYKNVSSYNYNQPIRQQGHENVFNKTDNTTINYQAKSQYNIHSNYNNNMPNSGTNNLPINNNVTSFYNKANNLNKHINVNPVISSSDNNILEMNISLNSNQIHDNDVKSLVPSNTSHYMEDIHSSYEDLQEEDEFSTNEENYSSDFSPNPYRKSMYSNSNFTNLPNLKRTVSTDCFNNGTANSDVMSKGNVTSTEHIISSPAMKHAKAPLSGKIGLQNSIRNSFFSNTDVYNLRSPSDVIKIPFNKSLSTSTSSYQQPSNYQSNISHVKSTSQSTNPFFKNKHLNLTKTTSEQFLSCSQKNEKLLKEGGFNHLNDNLSNQQPSNLLNENASSKFVSSIFLNLSSTSLANKNLKQEASTSQSNQQQPQQQQPQILHKQSSSAPLSSPLLSSPSSTSSSSPKEQSMKQNIFMQRPSTLCLNKANTANQNKINANNINNVPNKTTAENKSNSNINLNKRSNSAHNINNFQASKTPMSPVCKKRQPTFSELQVFQAQKESFEKLLHHIKDMTKFRDKLKDDVKQLETILVRSKLEASTNRIKPTNLQDLKKNNFVLRSEILRLSQHLQNNNNIINNHSNNNINHNNNNISHNNNINHQFSINNGNITVLSPSLIIKKDNESFFQYPNNNNNNFNCDNDDDDNVEDDDYGNDMNLYLKLNDKQRWSYNPSYNRKNC